MNDAKPLAIYTNTQTGFAHFLLSSIAVKFHT